MDRLVDLDRTFMKEALRLAAKGRGRTSPNPMVGAVVVQDGVIVGRGCHEFVGGPHAEVNALRDAGERARGGTLYVTLEPCNHHGRTPPCTIAVIEAGIARVVVGMDDPNPHVEGSGSEFLRSKGLRVDTKMLEREARLLNQPFIKHVTTGIPHVTLKAAATLDGRIATRTGDSRWITNEQSRRFVHRLRCDLDGILVGIGTALSDDPQLTARVRKRPACRQPVRIVIDTHLKLEVSSQLVKTAADVPVWIACGEGASAEKERALMQAGAVVLRMPEIEGRVSLPDLLEALGKRQVTSLLVEGGAGVLGSFIEQRLADEFHFFYAPKLLCDSEGVPMIQGGRRDHMSEALPAHDLRVRRFGEDVLLSGRFREQIY
jgi:diaminohydroxyphosphoribosylaminopyrimidine deaminase / 5-amino-6-(5-phosphoribosylamino)uracil reductase